MTPSTRAKAPGRSQPGGLLADPNHKLWVLLGQTKDTIGAVRAKEVAEYGITVPEASVLFVLHAAEQLDGIRATPAEICRWLFRKSNSISALLNRMEKKGLIRRINDLDKKNLVRVALTDKARAIFQKSSRVESLQRIMSKLSEEQRQQLWSGLILLRDSALKQLGTKQKPPYPHMV